MKEPDIHANDAFDFERHTKEWLPGWNQREIDRKENEGERRGEREREER